MQYLTLSYGRRSESCCKILDIVRSRGSDANLVKKLLASEPGDLKISLRVHLFYKLLGPKYKNWVWVGSVIFVLVYFFVFVFVLPIIFSF